MNPPSFGPSPEELAAKYSAISDIKIRQRTFLDDIAGFYNLGNRAVGGSSCVYESTPNSPGCAIGRCLPIDERPIGVIGIRSAMNKMPDLIPTWLSEMDTHGMFLVLCQCLHDNAGNWDLTGLSTQGEFKVREIKERCELK